MFLSYSHFLVVDTILLYPVYGWMGRGGHSKTIWLVSALSPYSSFSSFYRDSWTWGLFGQGHGLGLDNFVWHLCVKKVVLRLFSDLSLLFWTETLTIINELWHHVIEISSQMKSLKLHTRLKFTQSILYKILRALSYLTPLGEIISWRAPIVLFKVLHHD